MFWQGVGVEDGKARQALDSVAKHLATPHGIVLQQPAYSRYYIEYGEISTYPPGYKENAGIFCHNNPWVVPSLKLSAWQWRWGVRLLHSHLSRQPVKTSPMCIALEPYVYAQMIAGRDAPSHGEAKNSWLTGTAAWNYYTITQWILGIRPDYDGLKIAPVIPERWDDFRVQRMFRGVSYDISVVRKGSGNVVSLSVDGKPIAGDIVPPPADGVAKVTVEAIIG